SAGPRHRRNRRMREKPPPVGVQSPNGQPDSLGFAAPTMGTTCSGPGSSPAGRPIEVRRANDRLEISAVQRGSSAPRDTPAKPIAITTGNRQVHTYVRK